MIDPQVEIGLKEKLDFRPLTRSLLGFFSAAGMARAALPFQLALQLFQCEVQLFDIDKIIASSAPRSNFRLRLEHPNLFFSLRADHAGESSSHFALVFANKSPEQARAIGLVVCFHARRFLAVREQKSDELGKLDDQCLKMTLPDPLAHEPVVRPLSLLVPEQDPECTDYY